MLHLSSLLPDVIDYLDGIMFRIGKQKLTLWLQMQGLFWIGDPEIGTLNLRSELNLAIWCAFQEAGIEIPYPQREVWVLPGADCVRG